MPFNLSSLDMPATIACSDAITRVCGDSATLEEAAVSLCRLLYTEIVDESGKPACALVRVYKTHRYGELPDEVQKVARRAFGAVSFTPPEPEMKCLVLMGTAGDEADWNATGSSRGHRAIPLPTPQIVARAPMIAQLIRELGFDIAQVVRATRGVVRETAGKNYGVFYVDDARGSPYIPAQEAFVLPYAIRSVIGFGGALGTGELGAAIMFCRASIDAEIADRFRTVALDLSTALSQFSPERTFSA